MRTKQPTIDLTDLRKLLKEKPIDEVAKELGFKQVGNFRIFCKRNFVNVPNGRKLSKGSLR